MERTLDAKKDIRMFINEMNKTDKGKQMTWAYERGLITLEEYIKELFRIEKEILIEEGFKEQARRSFYED